MPLLIERDADISADFHAFYPELMAFAAENRSR
jgi:acyl carrier protein phosphodiesterase